MSLKKIVQYLNASCFSLRDGDSKSAQSSKTSMRTLAELRRTVFYTISILVPITIFIIIIIIIIIVWSSCLFVVWQLFSGQRIETLPSLTATQIICNSNCNIIVIIIFILFIILCYKMLRHSNTLNSPASNYGPEPR